MTQTPRIYAGNGALAARPEGHPPALSFRFQSWIDEGVGGRSYSTGNPGDAPMRFPRGEPSAAFVEEAKRVLPSYQAAAVGPSPDTMLGWLKMVGSLVRNPPALDMMPGLAKTFAAVLADVPVGCFTAETARRGAQTFEFWPSAADVAKLVQAEAQTIHRVLTDIASVASYEAVAVPERISRVVPFEELPSSQLTSDERALVLHHVKQKRAELAEELAGAEAFFPKPRAGGKPLHPDHLRALREADPLMQGARATQTEKSAAFEW